MKFGMNKILVVLAGLSLLGSTLVIVAEDSTINGDLPHTVEMGNLDPIAVGTMSLGQDAQAKESLCVYSNSGAPQAIIT